MQVEYDPIVRLFKDEGPLSSFIAAFKQVFPNEDILLINMNVHDSEGHPLVDVIQKPKTKTVTTIRGRPTEETNTINLLILEKNRLHASKIETHTTRTWKR